MKINSISARGFRNLADTSLEFESGVNVLYGSNAQGKTNLLEAIWLFSGMRSFRGKDSQPVAYGADRATLSIGFEADGRNQTSELILGEERRTILNGVRLRSSGELCGQLPMIIFSPDHLSLIKEGPEHRRRFIDNAITQLWPKYGDLLSRYRRAVGQRNSLLRDIRFNSSIYDMLDVYEQTLATLGAAIIRYRRRYVELLCEQAGDIYGRLSGGREVLSLAYMAEADAEGLARLLFDSRENDIKVQTTSVGPHRDDIEITINGHSARSFGSQGQQRSATITFKLCEAAVIRSVTGNQPIALLDDVMSELDSGRQDYILNHIDGWQVFITCCDRSSVNMLHSGAVFYVENGHISKER